MLNETYSIRPLVFLCALALGLIVLWASQATLYEIVQGSGRITPQSRTQSVQHLEGGIIQEIYVKEGDRVEKGQPLFLIDSLATNSEYNELMITRLFTRVKIARLLAELNNETHFNVPVDDLTASLSKNYKEFQRSQQDILTARRNEFEGNLKIVDEQINQKRLNIKKLKEELENRTSESEIAQKQLRIDQRLFDKGVISKAKLLQAESKSSSLATNVSSVLNEIPVSEAELKETQGKLQQIWEEFKTKVTGELSEEEVRFEQIEERLKKLKDKLARATVISPSKGTVNRLLVNTPGAVIQSGNVLLELTPTQGSVVVEGRVRAQDRGRIWLGQKAIVRVTAYDFSKYGGVDAEVEDISSDSFVDDYNTTFYRVKLKLDAQSIKDSEDLKILPGMTVDFHVKANKRTVLQTILAPVLEELWFGFSAFHEV